MNDLERLRIRFRVWDTILERTLFYFFTFFIFVFESFSVRVFDLSLLREIHASYVDGAFALPVSAELRSDRC